MISFPIFPTSKGIGLLTVIWTRAEQLPVRQRGFDFSTLTKIGSYIQHLLIPEEKTMVKILNFKGKI